MATGKIVEGDNVVLRGEVARVDDDGDRITVRIKGYGIPVTLRPRRDGTTDTETPQTAVRQADLGTSARLCDADACAVPLTVCIVTVASV